MEVAARSCSAILPTQQVSDPITLVGGVPRVRRIADHYREALSGFDPIDRVRLLRKRRDSEVHPPGEVLSWLQGVG